MNDALALKATQKNAQFLNGSQIAITQLKMAEMAEAIRQNMIIIREMVCLSGKMGFVIFILSIDFPLSRAVSR